MTPVTLPVLAQQLSTAQQAIDKAQRGIDKIQDDLKVVTEQALDRRVKKLEDTVTWLTRTVGAMVIGAIGSLLVVLLTR